jgi:hypothetical protein
MRPSTASARAIAIAACALVAVAGLRLWLDRDTTDASGTALPADLEQVAIDPAPAADLDAGGAPGAPADALDATDPTSRKLGWMPPPADTLAAVRGQVVDARSGLPLPGFSITFLSRRPKTAQAKTSSLGWFATGVELSSGVVAVLHAPDAADPRYAVRWSIEPREFLLPPAARAQSGAPPAEPFTIVLRASSPQTELDLDVVLPDGKPAAGASVSLTTGSRGERGEFQAESRAYEVADKSGRARFALHGDDVWARSSRIEADHGGSLVSELLEIDPPLGRAPRRVELVQGGIVRVRATTDDGKPVSGVSLWLSANEGTRFVTGRQGVTDALGEETFAALRAGCWNVTAIHPLTGRTLYEQVDLARGARADVDFQLTLTGLRLGLSGTVLDEDGYPLSGVGVRLQVPGEDPVELSTRELGRFELWARPASGVAVSVGGGFLDDRFEPSFLTLPFGTTGFQARRIARIEPETRAFVILDADTQKPVHRASIVLFHAAQSIGVEESALRAAAPTGFAQVTFKRRDDTQFVVDAPGYVRVEGRLAELVAKCGSNPLPLQVELEPGFERTLEVRDRATKRAVQGASFHAEGRVLATSGESGRVHLEGPSWPAVVHVVCAGYQPLAWDPRELQWPGSVVWLEPLR